VGKEPNLMTTRKVVTLKYITGTFSLVTSVYITLQKSQNICIQPTAINIFNTLLLRNFSATMSKTSIIKL
jgi:hypothetical protein